MFKLKMAYRHLLRIINLYLLNFFFAAGFLLALFCGHTTKFTRSLLRLGHARLN